MNSPPVPEGWEARWDGLSTQWYYVHIASGVSQWQQPGAVEKPGSYYSANPDLRDEPNEQSRGFISEATTGIAAGTLLEHGLSKFKHHHDDHHDHHDHKFNVSGLEGMAGLLSAAGAGALGAKFFGKKKHEHSPPPQTTTYAPPPTYAAVPVPVPVPYPPPAHQYSPPPPMSSLPHPSAQFTGGVVSGTILGGPPLIIRAAAFSGADVTRKLQALVASDQSFSMKGEDLISQFGDPWPESGSKRQLVVLYQYGERPMEVYVATSDLDKVEIINQPLITERMKFVNTSPSRIISLVWGRVNALNATRAEKLEKDGELETSELGEECGLWIGTRGSQALPVLVCFYYNDFGGISIGSARYQGTMRLPWNPLAKWN